mgnify:CR=1 FL=1
MNMTDPNKQYIRIPKQQVKWGLIVAGIIIVAFALFQCKKEDNDDYLVIDGQKINLTEQQKQWKKAADAESCRAARAFGFEDQIKAYCK